MKALGADIKDFFDNHWPENYYHDDNTLEFIDEDGVTWLLDDSKKYDLQDCGNLISEDSDEVISFSSAFSKWFKTKDTTTFIVTVPNDKIQQFQELLAVPWMKVKK